MSNVQVQLGGQSVQVQVQSSGFARANAAVTLAAASAAAAEVDAAAAAASAAAADADAIATAADRVQTGLDAVATAADRVQTGLDVVATGADAVSTAADALATAADAVQTGLDRAATAADAIATAADRVQTGLDAVATAADRVQTGLDRTAAATSASDAAATLAASALKANNLSDLASPSTARTNLGVAIGTNVQAYSANLDEYAGVNPTAAGLALLDDADASAQRTTLGLAIGTDVQAQDSDLTAIAALTSAADKMPYATGAGTWAMADLTTYARTLLATASNSAFLAALGQIDVVETDFLQAGTGAVTRTGRDKMRELVSPSDFTGGAEVALGVLRNTGDPAFSGAMFVPNASINLTEPVEIPVSFARVYGSGGGTFLAAPADDVFSAIGASSVQSSFSGFRTFSGADAFHIWPSGEIANLNFTDIVCSQFNDDAFSFANGLTSSKFTRCFVDSTLGARGIYCAAGINNDVAITDCDFTNLTGPAIKSVGLTQLWRISGLRVEENGQTGQHVFDLEAATAVNITGSWFEDHHEYLLKLTGDSDDGVTFDGCVDAGAKDGGSLKASLFDVGTNRVLFGSNTFTNSTAAPSRCFIWGVNSGLTTDASTVHARALNASEYVVSKKRSFPDAGSLEFDFLTVTRPDATDVGDNQQVIFVEMTIAVAGYVGGGVPRAGAWKARFTISTIGAVITDPDPYVVVDTGVGNIGAVTVAIAKSAAATSTSITMKMTIGGLDTSLDDYCQYDLRIFNMSSTDARRAVVSVL